MFHGLIIDKIYLFILVSALFSLPQFFFVILEGLNLLSDIRHKAKKKKKIR